MLKDFSFTFRMPTAVRDALERVAIRDLRTAGQYALKVIVTDLVRQGELTEDELQHALARAPRSDRGRSAHAKAQRRPRRR